MGDSGLEILHGGVGGDVELGARTSKHICAFAIDPISLNSLFTFVQSIILHIISYLLVLSIFHIALHYFILLFILLCLA